MSVVLGKHYTGYQPAENRKRGRPRITWRDTIMKDISQMKATRDEICRTAMNRVESMDRPMC